MNYTDKQIDALIADIYSGKYNPSDNLPEDLYFAIADHLVGGTYKGFGGSMADLAFGSTDQRLLDNLRENVYMFSGAKTYQQVREMSGMVADSKNLKEFKEKALAVYKQYNDDWLRAEYNTAIGQAAQAGQWIDIQADKETFPLLRYSAVMDANTSTICAPLNGITLPVDDPFWRKFSPLNHFNCRCVFEKIDKYTDVKTTGKNKIAALTKEMNDTVQPEFQMNPGRDGYIFKPDHPYFEVAPKDKAFAKRNFDLPIPEIKQNVKHEFAPDEIENWGVKLDNRVYDLLKSKVNATTVKKRGEGCFATPETNTIHMDITDERWKRSEKYQERVTYHEIGHIVHTQQNLIRCGWSVSDEYAAHFKSLKKLVKNPEQVNTQINALLRIAFRNDENLLPGILEGFGYKNRFELIEEAGAASDSLMALTNSKYGMGHEKAYMRKMGMKEAEMFAHSVENRFAGNLIFKEFMPEVYDESISFINKILER